MAKHIRKLICGGIPRYSLLGQRKLTYSQAWNLILDRCCGNPDDSGAKTFSFKGGKLALRLNKKHESILRGKLNKEKELSK